MNEFYYTLCRGYEALIDTPRRAKWFYQKLTRGYSDRDLWSLDCTFTDFILPRLKSFRKSKLNGYPACLEEGAVHNHGGSINKEQEEKNFQIWFGTIDKMILAFEYMKLNGDDLDSGVEDFEFVDSKKDGYKEMKIKKNEDKWSLYMKECKRRQEVIEEGLSLFSKYYQNLWD